MSSFVYVAREAGSGREVRNTVDASSEAAAIAALLNRNLLVVSIQEKAAKRGKVTSGAIALADLVVRLTDAVVGTDVVEVELNPVLVGTTGATAVDALLIVEQH